MKRKSLTRDSVGLDADLRRQSSGGYSATNPLLVESPAEFVDNLRLLVERVLGVILGTKLLESLSGEGFWFEFGFHRFGRIGVLTVLEEGMIFLGFVVQIVLLVEFRMGEG